MEEIIGGEAHTTEEHTRHHLTLEEQLAQLEAKDKKAKETEARRKAKMAKLPAFAKTGSLRQGAFGAWNPDGEPVAGGNGTLRQTPRRRNHHHGAA